MNKEQPKINIDESKLNGRFDYAEYERMKASMESKSVQCNGCKKPFVVSTLEFKEDTIPMQEEEIHIRYFTCPHCQKVYTIAKENTASLLLKQHYEAECQIYRKRLAKGTATDKGLRRILRLRAEYLRASQELNDKYQGEFNLLNSSVE